MHERAIHLLRRWSTVAFVLAAAWTVGAFVVPLELVLSIGVLCAIVAAGFGLRWYAEVLRDRDGAAASALQNGLSDDEGDSTP